MNINQNGKYRVDVVLGINCDDSFYQSFEKEFNSNTQARFKFMNAGFGQMEKTTTGFRMLSQNITKGKKNEIQNQQHNNYK